jgi:hypothetical protein
MIAKRLRGELLANPDKVLVNELLDDVLLTDISEPTRKIWRLGSNSHLRSFFGAMKACRVTTKAIETYRQNRLLDGVVDSTVNRELTILRTVKHSGTERKSAPRHTLDAGNTAKSAVKLAAQRVVNAYKKVV